MKRKFLICIIGGLLLFAGIAFCFSAKQRQPKNDVFTDAFFADVTGIELRGWSNGTLEGAETEAIICYLKGLRLAPTEDTVYVPKSDEYVFGGPAQYYVNYKNGSTVHFTSSWTASGTLFEIYDKEGQKNYYVVDEAGNRVDDYDETLWTFFNREGEA